jgi:hypothetical protein
MHRSRDKFNIIRPSGDVDSPIFHEFADLLSFSFIEMGFLSQVSNSKALMDTKNIVIGCFYEDKFFSKLPTDSVIINTEQLFSGDSISPNGKWSEQVLELSRKFEIWDYSETNIAKLKGLNTTARVKFLEVGYQEKLKRIPKNQPDIDVLFYGSPNERRIKVLDELKSMNLKVVNLYRVHGLERDSYISRSKIVLNMHFHPTQIFEIIRVHYLMNNSKAILCEFNANTSAPDWYLRGLATAPYDELAERCSALIHNPQEIQRLESKSLETIQEKTQTSILSDLLQLESQ